MLSCDNPLAYATPILSMLIDMYYIKKNSKTGPAYAEEGLSIPDSYFDEQGFGYLKNEYHKLEKKYNEFMKPIREYLKKNPLTEI